MSTAYRAPKEPGYLGSYNWFSTITGLFLLLASNVISTQYIAAKFDYQTTLGAPLFIIGRFSIYQPFLWGRWILRFGSSENYAIRQPMLYSALIFSIGAFVSLIIVALLNMFHNKKLTTNTEDLHGSARWATEKELRETGLLDNEKGVYVGGWKDPKTNKLHYLKDDSTEHLLLYAPTGSGKGVSICIPTLLSWEESVVVYDIKGENWAKTSGFRQAGGQVCMKFAPVESNGVRFNPLAEIRIGTDREVSDAQSLAEMLCRSGKESPGDEHWTTTAVSLITGLLLHVCYVAQKSGRFATLSDLSAALTPIESSANLPDQTEDAEKGNPVRDHFEAIKIAAHDPNEERGWKDAQKANTSTHPLVAEKVQEMLNREDREFSSVLSTAKRSLTLYSDPLVALNVSASDFAISDLVNFTKPISLYIVVPPSDKVRLKPLVRLLFTMIVNRLTEKMDFEGTEQSKNKHRLLFLIDEFPTLGNMAIFADALAYMRGYGLKAYLIAQDLGQIVEHYTRNESISSNCNIRIAFAPNKTETAELISKMTGTTTVKKAAVSFSGHRSSNIMTNMSTNVEHIQRPLMTVDEVMRLPAAKKEGTGANRRVTEPGAMLIFVAGAYPVYGTQMLYFADQELLRRASFPPPTELYVIDHNGGISNPGTLKPLRRTQPRGKLLPASVQIVRQDAQDMPFKAATVAVEAIHDQQFGEDTDGDDLEFAQSISAHTYNPSATGGEGQEEDSEEPYIADDTVDDEFSYPDEIDSEPEENNPTAVIHLAQRAEPYHNER
jgi:type IV secretion system protein VirD4